MLQGTMAERVITKYPHLTESFDGFTVFSRAFSSFPFTAFSRQSIDSGYLYISESTDLFDHLDATFENSFFRDLMDSGFYVNTIGNEYGNEIPGIINKMPERPWTVYGTVASASIARLTGYWMPNPFAPNVWDGNLNMLEDSLNTLKLFVDNVSGGDSGDKLIYIWNISLHAPLSFDRQGKLIPDVNVVEATEQDFIDEVYYVFLQVIRLFEAMKYHDVYNNSLIIILSDHGYAHGSIAWEQDHVMYHQDFPDGAINFGNFRPATAYNASILIKPPNAQGKAIITHNPAWNGDLRAIINFYLNDFSNINPLDVVADIRANNHEVGILFAPLGVDIIEIWESSKQHEIIYVTSLYDIPTAFATHSGIKE